MLALLALGALVCAHSQGFMAGPSWVLRARENLQIDRDPAQPAVIFDVGPDREGPLEQERQAESSPAAAVRAWQVQVLNSDLAKVAYVQGRGAPPEDGIPWYGLSPEGTLLEDGFYRARFVWRDVGGRDHGTSPVEFSLLTMNRLRDFLGPQVSLDYTARGLIIRVREGLLFAPGAWDIQPGSEKTLGQIADFLKDHPKNRIVVQGYTDDTGSLAANAAVSRRRAQAVYDFFVGNGLSAAQARYEGLGPRKPIADNRTAEGRARNRRVEIVVLKRTS